MPISIKTVWQAAEDGAPFSAEGGWNTDRPYAACRIPGILCTPRGTLLLYCEARDTLSDWARIDLLLFRSEDGGTTFSGPQVLASGDEAHPTANNPVMISARDGSLCFLYCRDYTVGGGDAFLRRSFDDGLSWTPPENVMQPTRPGEHNAFAFGPGHGVETRDGVLVSPVWFVPKSAGTDLRSHHPAVVSTFCSADGGRTWDLGEVIPASEGCPDPNETAVAATSDGGVYLNTRLTGAGYRASTRSSRPDRGFAPLTPVCEMPDPTCMGSLAQTGDREGTVFLSVNCNSAADRRNLTLRLSFDEGHSWPCALTVEPGDAGYADLCVIPGEDPTVCVLYEQRWGTTLKFASLPLSVLNCRKTE